MVEQYDVLEQRAFLNVTRGLSIKAQDKHWVKAMVWYPDTPTLEMIDLLKEVAQRGVDARVLVDSYSLMTINFQNNFPPVRWFRERSISNELRRILRRREKATLAMLQDLRGAGVRVDLSNKPNLVQRFIPQLGRDHQKAEVIDGTGFLMGFNFTGYNFTAFDLAIALTDKKIVESLAEEMVVGSKNDREICCTDETSLLIDSGKMGQSIILDRAAEMVRNATEDVWLVSLFRPNGKLAHQMDRARKRGVGVEAITSREDWMRVVPLYYKFLYRMNRLIEGLMQHRVPVRFHNPDIHAKFLIADQQVLFGSHNFVQEGVWAGTREIGLFSTNHILATNLRRYAYDLSSNSRNG